MSDRYYNILGHEPEFYAGTVAGGGQVLMGMQSFTEVIGLFFDRDGEFTHAETRQLPQEPPVVDDNPYDPDFLAKVAATIRAWQTEMGLENGRIRVRRFSCEGNAIDDLPGHYKEFLDDPVRFEPDAERREAWRAEIQKWIDSRKFVLYWGQDYWMEADGHVHST